MSEVTLNKLIGNEDKLMEEFLGYVPTKVIEPFEFFVLVNKDTGRYISYSRDDVKEIELAEAYDSYDNACESLGDDEDYDIFKVKAHYELTKE